MIPCSLEVREYNSIIFFVVLCLFVKATPRENREDRKETLNTKFS